MAQSSERESERGMLLKAFGCLFVAAATAAGCTAFVQRRRGPATAVQLSEASRWVYRRVHDLGGRSTTEPHMAARLSHARLRARRERTRANRLAHSQGAQCYSLSRRQCASHNEVPVNGSCTHPAADHLSAKEATVICGKRLPHRSPCWEEHGNVSCLPAAFLLGEMRLPR